MAATVYSTDSQKLTAKLSTKQQKNLVRDNYYAIPNLPSILTLR